MANVYKVVAIAVPEEHLKAFEMIFEAFIEEDTGPWVQGVRDYGTYTEAPAATAASDKMYMQGERIDTNE